MLIDSGTHEGSAAMVVVASSISIDSSTFVILAGLCGDEGGEREGAISSMSIRGGRSTCRPAPLVLAYGGRLC